MSITPNAVGFEAVAWQRLSNVTNMFSTWMDAGSPFWLKLLEGPHELFGLHRIDFTIQEAGSLLAILTCMLTLLMGACILNRNPYGARLIKGERISPGQAWGKRLAGIA